MPLRFDRHRDGRRRRPMVAPTSLRLVSLAAGLAFVILLMQMAQSPETKRKLGLMFGEPPAAGPAAGVVRRDTANGDTLPDYLDEVDPELLQAVTDNTTFRNEETEAWFHLLSVARDADPQQLAAASLGEIVYAQFLGQPEVYRGRVVTVAGITRRVERVRPAANDLGIEQLYRVIVQPYRDGRRPFTLYCLELPEGWSTDAPENEAITFTGFFFKNWVYEHQTGIDLSPVFLAKSFAPELAAMPAAEPPTLLPVWQLVALATIIAAAVVIAVWRLGKVGPRLATPPEESAAVAESLRELDQDAS